MTSRGQVLREHLRLVGARAGGRSTRGLVFIGPYCPGSASRCGLHSEDGCPERRGPSGVTLAETNDTRHRDLAPMLNAPARFSRRSTVRASNAGAVISGPRCTQAVPRLLAGLPLEG